MELALYLVLHPTTDIGRDAVRRKKEHTDSDKIAPYAPLTTACQEVLRNDPRRSWRVTWDVPTQAHVLYIDCVVHGIPVFDEVPIPTDWEVTEVRVVAKYFTMQKSPPLGLYAPKPWPLKEPDTEPGERSKISIDLDPVPGMQFPHLSVHAKCVPELLLEVFEHIQKVRKGDLEKSPWTCTNRWT